jgi:flagellar export protein FliJ
MSRATRFEPVHAIARSAESNCAARLAGMERRLQDAERREQELLRYRAEYQQAFQQRGSDGLDVRSLREYQVFLARLAAAIAAQQSTLDQLRASCQRERIDLRGAVARRQSLGKVIEKVHAEEQKVSDKRFQHELDERAMRQSLVHK